METTGRCEASARPPPRGRSQTLPSFDYLPRWTSASRQLPSVADGRVPEALVRWDWGRASGLWAGVCLSGSLKGFRRESRARVRTPRSPERLLALTRGFPHLLEGKQLAGPSGRRTMEGNELEIISALSLPRLVRAAPRPFCRPRRGTCHSYHPSRCLRPHRSPLSPPPQTWCFVGLAFMSHYTVHWKGSFAVFTLL